MLQKDYRQLVKENAHVTGLPNLHAVRASLARSFKDYVSKSDGSFRPKVFEINQHNIDADFQNV